ncbi:MAG: hypothetical protein HY302_03635 [Opitutae bacterium]|nr:hypothetical protein [Opitutae bacterium]
MDTSTVSPTCSRKTFFAKLAGLAVASGMVPFLSTKARGRPAAPAPADLRSETRAVPRQAGSV